MTKRTTDDGSGLLCAVAIVLAAMVLATSVRVAPAGETPVYGLDGKYQGSVHDYGRTQTYTDRRGHFVGSSINQGNGTTSFFDKNGHFAGSAGSSINRAFNFNRGGRR
jgi:hypothetical protein